MQIPRSKVGTFTGTGAALTVNINFKPVFVRIWNETDGTQSFESVTGLTDDKAYQLLDSGVGTTDASLLAANGITLTANGFKVGTSISTNAKVYRFLALS
jgi:hypothetical protein